MTEDQCVSLFSVAGIEVLAIWELANQYWPRPDYEDVTDYGKRQALHYGELCATSPWWLVKTKFGLIEIGWRKRVISIGWQDTEVVADVTADPVTKGKYMVHAENELKAVEYLTFLRQETERAKCPHDELDAAMERQEIAGDIRDAERKW